MIEQLAFTLFKILVALVILSVVLLCVSYARTRKRSAVYYDNQELKLQYFVQKQVDYRNRVTGYECLLRQREDDGTWILPKDMDGLPLQRVIQLLEYTFQSLPKEQFALSINLSYKQVMSPDFNYFVRWAISNISPMTLTVEVHVDKRLSKVNQLIFRRRIQQAHSYGMKLAMDNVGADMSNLKNIEWLLPEIDILKCSMRDFRKADSSVWLDLNLQFWNRLATEHHIQLMLMGIENEVDEALAEQLKINWRQGYLFGKPTRTAN